MTTTTTATTHTQPKVKPNAAKDVRLLDHQTVILRVSSLLDHLFGITRDNEKCWIVPPNRIIPGVLKVYINDYPRMKFTEKKYMLSHLVKLLQINQGLHDKDQYGEYILYPNVERYSVDLSHLCHQPQCINPFHLIFELRTTNLGRAMCAKLKTCQQNHNGPNCLINTESHPVVFDDSIDLHIKRGRPRKDPSTTDHRKKPPPVTFIKVTPFNHTELKFPLLIDDDTDEET